MDCPLIHASLRSKAHENAVIFQKEIITFLSLFMALAFFIRTNLFIHILIFVVPSAPTFLTDSMRFPRYGDSVIFRNTKIINENFLLMLKDNFRKHSKDNPIKFRTNSITYSLLALEYDGFGVLIASFDNGIHPWLANDLVPLVSTFLFHHPKELAP